MILFLVTNHLKVAELINKSLVSCLYASNQITKK